jgi:cytochrome c oxidase assembly factor CtaG
MLAISPKEQESEEKVGWLRKTSQRIMAIGACLRDWLRATEKMEFTKEPSHTPDPKFIEELARLLTREQTTKSD